MAEQLTPEVLITPLIPELETLTFEGITRTLISLRIAQNTRPDDERLERKTELLQALREPKQLTASLMAARIQENQLLTQEAIISKNGQDQRALLTIREQLSRTRQEISLFVAARQVLGLKKPSEYPPLRLKGVEIITIPPELLKHRLQIQEKYIESLKNKWNLDNQNPRVLRTLYRLNGGKQSYWEELEALNAPLPPMSEECEIVAVIPAYNEEKQIERTLKGWVEQCEKETGRAMTPEKVEIIILVNRPNQEKPYDRTLQIIQNLKSKTPYNKFAIQAVEKTFNFPEKEEEKAVVINERKIKVGGGVKMGLVYSVAADLAVLRNSKREGSEKKANLLIRTGGADAYARHRNFIDRTSRIFREKPELEQYNFRADYPRRIYEHVPLLHVVDRFREMMNIQYTDRKSLLGLGTYRMSLYCEGGGFNPDDSIREEVNLNLRMRQKIAQKMAKERRERKDFIRRDLVLNAIDDPRRSLAAIWKGIPLLYVYGDFEDRRKLELMDIEKILRQPVPPEARLTASNLQHQLEPYFQFYIRQLYQYSSQTKGNFRESCLLGEKFLRRAFTFLGVRPKDYELIFERNINQQTMVDDIRRAVNQCHLRIKDISHLQRLIREYKKRGGPAWTK